MQISRRHAALLLPALARAAEKPAVLPSKVYKFDELPAKKNAKGNISRAILDGATHTGYPIEAHSTELKPGEMPHPPHHHAHEEMVFVEQGTMEVTISGKAERCGPGSAAFVASGEEHGWKNVGTTNARYFVIAFGREKA